VDALPRVDDCLDLLGEARYFSTLDATCGYWQIDVNGPDREKTAFTSHKELYQFKLMPFGLMTAPATFQRAIDIVLSSVRFQCALTYLDDIVIYSPTFDQHLKDLSRVLRLLQDGGNGIFVVFATKQIDAFKTRQKRKVVGILNFMARADMGEYTKDFEGAEDLGSRKEYVKAVLNIVRKSIKNGSDAGNMFPAGE
jgi:hypothetical protein